MFVVTFNSIVVYQKQKKTKSQKRKKILCLVQYMDIRCIKEYSRSGLIPTGTFQDIVSTKMDNIGKKTLVTIREQGRNPPNFKIVLHLENNLNAIADKSSIVSEYIGCSTLCCNTIQIKDGNLVSTIQIIVDKQGKRMYQLDRDADSMSLRIALVHGEAVPLKIQLTEIF